MDSEERELWPSGARRRSPTQLVSSAGRQGRSTPNSALKPKWLEQRFDGSTAAENHPDRSPPASPHLSERKPGDGRVRGEREHTRCDPPHRAHFHERGGMDNG